MTVAADVERQVTYTATGSTTGPFAVPFPFFEIEVYLDGDLVSITDYTIDQDAAGETGDVIFDSAPTGDVLIIGATEIEQQIDYISVDAVEPDSAERGLDRLTMIAQEHDELFSRSFRVGNGDDPIAVIDLGSVAGLPVITRADGGIDDYNSGVAGYLVVDSDGVMSSTTVVPDGTPISRISVDPATGSPYTITTHVPLARVDGEETITESWPTDVLFLMLDNKGVINGTISATPPVDTTVLWLDVSAGTSVPGTWKAYEGGAWVACAGADVAKHIVEYGSAVATLDADTLDGLDSTAFALASHTHAAADIVSGTIATARLGSGTANSTTFLRGDQTYAVPTGSGVSDVRLGAEVGTALNPGTYRFTAGHVLTGVFVAGEGFITTAYNRPIQKDVGAGWVTVSEA